MVPVPRYFAVGSCSVMQNNGDERLWCRGTLLKRVNWMNKQSRSANDAKSNNPDVSRAHRARTSILDVQALLDPGLGDRAGRMIGA